MRVWRSDKSIVGGTYIQADFAGIRGEKIRAFHILEITIQGVESPFCMHKKEVTK